MLVLASASPRRRDLLAQAGYAFEVLPADIPEDPHPGEAPIAYVLRLAREKAEAVAASSAFAALTLRFRRTAPDPRRATPPSSPPTAKSSPSPKTMPTQPACCACLPAPRTRSSPASRSSHPRPPSPHRSRRRSHLGHHAHAHRRRPRPLHRHRRTPRQSRRLRHPGQAARWIPRIHGCYFNVVGLPLALVASMIEGVESRLRAAKELQLQTPAAPSTRSSIPACG